jgi:hypothetical protein
MIIINLNRIGTFEFQEKTFFDLFLKNKIKNLNKFDLVIFKKLEKLEDKILFGISVDLEKTIKSFLRDKVLNLHEIILKDDILFKSGADIYEILYYYEKMFDEQFDIQYEKTIYPFLSH